MGLNVNPYSNTPIKNLEYIQNKALVIAPFEIIKSGLLDTDLMLDTPGTITMYFFRKTFNDIDKEPTTEQFKTVGTVSDINTKLGLDISASNISSSITSSYYLGFTKINVIFKYDKNTGIRTIEKNNSLLGEDYIDIGIDNTIDLTAEDYFVICNVTKNTKATNTSFTDTTGMDFLFMIPSSECQEIITDFDILDANNKTINIKKYGTLGSNFVADNDTIIETTIEPAYEADFFGDGSNIATYLFDGTARDLTGNYNGATTGVTYGEGKVGQAAVFDGTGTFRSKINLSGYTSYTMSTWVKKPTTTSTFSMGQGVNATGPRCELLWYHDGYLYAECGSGYNNFNKYLPPVNDTNWHHILYTFNNGITNMYFDGVLLSLVSSSGTLSTTVPIFTNEDFIIGLRYNISIVSHVDQVRIFNRALNQNEVTALYLNSISTRVIKQESNVVNDNWTRIQLETVETIPPSSIVEQTGKVITNSGVTVSNNIYKNGDGSIYLGTNTNYLTSPSSLDFAFGTGDFTIECWVKKNISTSSIYLFSVGNLTFKVLGTSYWNLQIDGRNPAEPAGINDMDWHFLAVQRKNGIVSYYYDGILKISHSHNSTISSGLFTLNYGVSDGFIDDLRISKDIARYNVDFTPPTSGLVKDNNTVFLLQAANSNQPLTIKDPKRKDFFGDKSMVACYMLDSNANDETGFYNGTATNITYMDGKFGKCANFDGVTSKLSNSDLPLTNSMSISFWMKKEDFSQTWESYITLGKDNEGQYKYISIIRLNNTDKFRLEVGNGSHIYKLFPTVTTTISIDNNWHHYILVIDSILDKISIYKDNNKEEILGNFSSTVTLSGGNGLHLGNPERSDGRYLAKCQLDNVKIFNRALTDSEVTSLYNETISPIITLETESEVQDLYKETKRVKYKAITLNETNFGPASKFIIETQKEIKLLNYKTWTGTDSTKQGYRIYPVMNISDHTTEETTFNPKYYLGTKYQRNLSEILSQGIKSKRTISNLKDMYLVDDLCIQTLKKINILLENDQMIKFSERLYQNGIREKINADLILEYLSIPVSGSSNNDINSILKTSLIEDYNFTQDEIDNLNDNLNTFKSRARIALNAPVIQGSGLDQFKFTLPKTFIDNNRSKTEKKNLLVFGTDAGFNKFNLNSYSAPYSNVTKRDAASALNLSDLVANTPVVSDSSDTLIDSYTKLFISGSITDLIGSTISNTGNVVLSKTTVKNNINSLELNSGSKWLAIQNTSSQFSFGLNEFTIEFNLNTVVNGDIPIMTFGLNGTSLVMGIYVGSTGAINVGYGGGGWSWINDWVGTAANVIKSNIWTNIVIQRRSGNIEIYIDGVKKFTRAWAINLAVPQYCFISSYFGVAGFSIGYIDDIRISNGIARYTTDFTVKPLRIMNASFKDILTNYKQQIPFTYIPLSTDIKDINDKPVFETLTNITGFCKSEIIIDIPNVL